MIRTFVNKLDQRAKPKTPAAQLWLEIVQDRIGSMLFGEVEIVIQDSKVIQIDSTERLRLDPPQQRQAPRTSGRPSLAPRR